METLANMQLVTNEISMKVNDIPDGEFKIIPKFTRSVGMLSETKGYMELRIPLIIHSQSILRSA